MDSEENLGERSKCRKMDRDINNLCMRFCPEGVSYIPLGEATEMQRGTSITKKNIIEGTVPVIAGGQKPAYYCDKANRDVDIITVAGSGAYAGYVSYWDCPVFVSDAFSVKAKEGSSTKYIYYAMQNLQSEIYATKKGGGVPHVHISSIEKMRIPLPPLPIQQEIIRILDTFTNLTAELTAELTARRKQYEYYRDELLTFGEDVEYKKLGEVVSMKAGKAIKAQDIGEKNELFSIPCYGGNGLRGYVKDANCSGDKVLIGRQGALCGNVCFVSGEFYATEHAVVVSSDNNVDMRFLFHLLLKLNLNQYKTAGAQPGLSVSKLETVKVQIPSIEYQRRVSKVLDLFSRYIDNLEDGLPAEISARQKQYEYYRDKLLQFSV